MLNALDCYGGYAVSRENAKMIPSNFIIDKQDFYDFGGCVVEVWKYDPFLLSKSKTVDEISLLLELNNEKDERVQIELDSIRCKYVLTQGER